MITTPDLWKISFCLRLMLNFNSHIPAIMFKESLGGEDIRK